MISNKGCWWFFLSTVLAGLVAFPFSTYSQDLTSPEFIATRWGLEDGLPQSSVNAIIQSRDGYIWFATYGGLVRFNGAEFKSFDRFNSPGLENDRLLSVAEFGDSTLWCTSEIGITRFKNGVFQSWATLSNFQPMALREDGKKRVWVQTDSLPLLLTRDGLSFAPAKKGFKTEPFSKDPDGIFLFQNRRVLATSGDSFYVFADLAKVISSSIHSVTEYPENSGILWLSTTASGLIRFEKGNIKIYNTKNGLPSDYIRRVYFDKEGRHWVECFQGIALKTGDSFHLLKTNLSGLDKEYKRMMQDREGNYWVGSHASGLFRLRLPLVHTMGSESGLKEEKMLSIAEMKNGNLLLATNCGGIYEFKNGKASYSELNPFLKNLCVWSVFQDSKGQIWTGSRSLTVFNQLNKPGKTFGKESGFTGQFVYAITEDRNGLIWIGDVNGLFSFDGNRFTRFSTDDGLSGNEVRTIVEDKSGVLWIGTANGLNKLFSRKIEQISFQTAEKDSVSESGFYVRAILPDSNGDLWVGTYGHGLFRIKDRQINQVTTENGLFDNIISHLVEDENENIWMGSNRGIFYVSKSDLNSVADGITDNLLCFSLGLSDGMKSPETNGGFQPSSFLDQNGNLFFPTVSGVAIVKTRDANPNRLIPPVSIEQIISHVRTFIPGHPVVLPYDSSGIEIRFAALSYSDQKKIKYKYKLEGFDSDWIDAGSRRIAFYSKLPPGEYKFHVIASNNDGFWNKEGASFFITVLTPFWMTWWFRIIVISLFLLIIPSYNFYRFKQIQKEKEQQEHFAEGLITSQEQERRRIAADLHDGLGQQILVIKNRAELAMRTVDDPVKTMEQLQEISRSSLSSIQDVRAITRGLRPIHLEQFGLTDTLENLAEQIQQSSAIEWYYHIENINGFIPPEKEISFFRIIQEGINNILKHAQATEASLVVRLTDGNVVAFLWDNGLGFDSSTMTSGLGLTGIRERAKSLGGICAILSKPGDGTTITITIPKKPNV